MGHDVFVSHSAKDKITADAVCAVLESRGIRCWVAPRDITPGKDWGESIVDAIKGARAMVLVFSNHANTSPQIKREVERAVNKGIPIIPLRIENVVPTASLEYFLSTPHWLDAFTPPLEKHLEHLAQVIRQIIEVTAPATGVAIPPSPDKHALPGKIGPAKHAPARAKKSKSLLLVAAAILLLLGTGGWYFGMYVPAENARKAKETQIEAAKQQALAEQKRLEAEKERLANATGFASVKTTPTGASVSIDNSAAQESPAVFKSLKLGKHSVSISLDGYEPFTGEIEIKENDIMPLDKTLIRSKGTLTLSTTPKGVSYTVSGGAEVESRTDLTGTTPATLENLPTGDYQVQFQRDGWPVSIKSIQVPRNKTASAQQDFSAGTVVLTSDPSGASVMQNDRLFGMTPLTLTNLPPGELALQLQLAGFSPTNFTETVKAGGKSTRNIYFARGAVQISSEPSGASILQNGKSLGSTPLTLNNLAPGTHLYTLQLSGYTATNIATTVKGGETADLSARLRRPMEDFIGKWNFLHGGRRVLMEADGINSQVDYNEYFYELRETSGGELEMAAEREDYTMTVNSGIAKGSTTVSESVYPPGDTSITINVGGGNGGGQSGFGNLLGAMVVAAAKPKTIQGTVSYTVQYLPEKNMVVLFAHRIVNSIAVEKEDIFALDSTRTKLVDFLVPTDKKQSNAYSKLRPVPVNLVASANDINDDLINRVINSHLQPDGSGFTGGLTYAVKVNR
ncbi:MAG TPA: PEGA domain-containing protein [Candidatus Baltobacteraceae bacterium]|nr:PEGA domain-containing protein [Candidatus Baltobacteraceae bacterium]